MQDSISWRRLLFLIGVLCVLIGALDPLEGSVLILAGSGMLAACTFNDKEERWKWYVGAFAAIAFGVFFLFFLSSLGGFGGTSELSWWWGILILPYPIAWVFLIVILALRLFGKPGKPPKDADKETEILDYPTKD